MKFMEAFCPQSLPVWNGHDFSPCFENLFFGVAGDCILVLAIIRQFVIARNKRTLLLVNQKFYGSYCMKILLIVGLVLSVWRGLFLSFQWCSKQVHAPTYSLMHAASKFAAWACSLTLFYNCEYSIVANGWITSACWFFWPAMSLPMMRTILLSNKSQVLHHWDQLLMVTVSTSFAVLILVNAISRDDSKKCVAERKGEGLTDTLLQPCRSGNEGQHPTMVGKLRRVQGWFTFSYVNPLIAIGMKQQLGYSDLLPLPNELCAEVCCEELSKIWLENGKNPSVFWAFVSCYGWTYFAIGVLKATNDIMAFTGPVLLNAIIKSVDAEGKQKSGYWFAIGLGSVSALRAVLGTQYSFCIARLRLQLKGGITAIIFRKTLRISLAERSSLSNGEIHTLMSVDADRAVNLCLSLHDLWSLPLQMLVALWMLYREVKFACLAGLALIIILIPVNRWIAVKITTANKHMMEEKDERIRRMCELLTHVRTLKMYAWEHLFANRVAEIRTKELQHLAVRKYLDALCVYFWACTPTLFSFLTFGLFVLWGHPLDAATVFTSLSLFNILISPLNSFPWVITGIIEASTSIERLNRFLTCPDMRNGFIKYSPPVSGSEENLMKDVDISIYSSDFAWGNVHHDCLLSLKQISVEMPRGFLVVVTGQVGAGKSSLLQAILGEMHCPLGSVHVGGSTAFVSQVPWIQSGTLRDNILFGKQYDEQRYNGVISACALDMDIEDMHYGDLAEIGERGHNLSGGQKSRLALARAIYQDCDIYLLDDPLSSVDAHVAAWILEHAIQGPLLANKTRVLCTHYIPAISAADMVIFMDDGYVKNVSYAPRLASSSLPDDLLHGIALNALDSGAFSSFHVRMGEQVDHSLLNIANGHGQLKECEIKEVSELDGLLVPLVEKEARREGHVEVLVYRSYATFVGWSTLGVILTSTLFMQMSRNGNDLWLSHWVDSDMDKSIRLFLKVLFLIAISNSVFTLARAFSFAYGGLRAAYEIHKSLLLNIASAPISFFDQNPGGRILNRFSSDLYTIDDSLPFIANILLANLFGLVGILLVVGFIEWAFLLVLIPLLYIFRNLQVAYRATSRELRRLDSVSRSPVYTSFVEALDGAPIIRAFNSQELFEAKNAHLISANQRASFSETCASLWLSIRLQMMASFVVFFISIVAIGSQTKSFPVRSIAAGLVGLALSYATPIISLLSDILTTFTETEKEMVSMERMHQYLDIEKEGCGGNIDVGTSWPLEGAVTFSNVSLIYRPGLPRSLDDVSFSISAGQKVGIAGRTGAGKSSILAALFRLTPHIYGQIIVDGIETSSIRLQELRSRLVVVPQMPFLFKGTIRENLDPCGKASDFMLWNVLEKCHIKGTAVAAGGLDACVQEGGERLSLGQRQLICLARSLLQHSHVICFDECTANIDPHTTSLLKRTVASECTGMTVLTIAHRISTIQDLERVLIMDHGKLVEDGDPKVLLADPSSRFFNLKKASVE